jgi:hypothetical protein
MKLNIFYGLLHQLLIAAPEFKLLNVAVPVYDKTLEDKEYYRLELPSADIATEGLELYETHLSVYKEVDPHNPNLGPVHFTAKFHDDERREFRMHLFLNHFDTLARSPTWELFNDEHRYVKVDPPANMDYLTHAIWQHGLPYLQELRKQHKNLESRLSNDYERLEQQTSLLHVHLTENKQAYLESLVTLINTTELLSQISTNAYWSRTVSYLKKLQKLMTDANEGLGEKQQTDKQEKDVEEVSSTPARSVTHKEKRPHAKIRDVQQTSFFQSIKDCNPIVKEIQKQITQFEVLSDKAAKTEDKHIKALILIDLNNQLISIDLEKEALTSTQIKALSQIEVKLTQQGKKLLLMALLNRDYDFARTLSPFYDLISQDILVMALMQKNDTLLGFLAKDMGFPINSYPIVIKEQSYANAIAYCFSQSSDNTSLLECFNVLIKQGANLMQETGADNLPLAHLILSTSPKHPLYAALEQNKDLTLNNQYFYGHLINSLNRCLRTGHFEKEKRVELDNWIKRYGQLKSSAECNHVLLNTKNQVITAEISEIAKRYMSAAMAEALTHDEEVVKDKLALDKEHVGLLEKMKRFQRVSGRYFAYQSIVHALNKDFKSELLKNEFKIDIGFSELKSATLKTISNARLLTQYCNELLDVQAQLIRAPQIVGQRNKRLKQLDRRQKELIESIEGLNKMMPHALIKEYNELQDSINQLVGYGGDLKTRLSTLAKLLEELNRSMPTDSETNDVSTDEEQSEGIAPNCLLQ